MSEPKASARENHPTRERRDAAARGVIFKRVRVSLARLLSLRKNGEYS